MVPEKTATHEPGNGDKAVPSDNSSHEASPDLDSERKHESTNTEDDIEDTAGPPSTDEISPNDHNPAEPELPESPGEDSLLNENGGSNAGEEAASADSIQDAGDDTAGEEPEDRLEVREAYYESDQTKNNEIIELSNAQLAIVLLPLICLAGCFWWLDLISVSTSILSGSFRAFLQLSFLGAFLVPVFKLGVDRPLVVLIYSLSMVALAANEATSRTKYTYDGQFYHILATLLFNVAWVGIFAFAFILKPNPL